MAYGELYRVPFFDVDENKFILPGQGGLIPVPDGGSVSNTDSRMTFRNSFRASQKEPS